MAITDNQKIGVMLCAIGFLFITFGVMMMFDTMLLTIGNILFLGGLAITMGPSATIRFFTTRWQKIGPRGVFCFFGGIALVLAKWPVVGMILEVFGFLNLFGNFFPIVISAMRQMPILSNILSLPIISTIADKLERPQRASQWA
uniref:Vesicle transport protein n=1 Tax=Octactis speculum TaxID=3111310 RepID=A0A7S2CR74_9STRA|mmetsp:Transcript_39068/g.52980  ORF Transcript_39068/g.52980 Transcript_39068/m.52980 type:complete len:144 (+) Transcript_39068:65-496(+)